MINTLKNYLASDQSRLRRFSKTRAVILDVRSPGEQGHIKGSINTPLNDLSRHIPKLKERYYYYLLCIRNAVLLQKHLKIEWFYTSS
jgi:3-mercaptopyruvate sulfurtransferase SseA